MDTDTESYRDGMRGLKMDRRTCYKCGRGSVVLQEDSKLVDKRNEIAGGQPCYGCGETMHGGRTDGQTLSK